MIPPLPLLKPKPYPPLPFVQWAKTVVLCGPFFVIFLLDMRT